MVELQRQATIDKVEIDRLRRKLAALEERVDREAEERAAAAARAAAPRGLAEETVPPPRKVEVIEVSDLEEPLDEERALATDPATAGSGSPSDRRPSGASLSSAPRGPAEEGSIDPAADASAAAGDDAPEALPAEPAEPALEAPAGASTRITSAAQAVYDQGYSLYHQGRYVEAEETFQRFLAAYARTDLGDNARYWIGECRLARDDLQSALAAFRETVREYPDGNKSPDALLRAGTVLERLGDDDGARASYREVERRFPESTASEEAAKRLERL